MRGVSEVHISMLTGISCSGFVCASKVARAGFEHLDTRSLNAGRLLDNLYTVTINISHHLGLLCQPLNNWENFSRNVSILAGTLPVV